MTDLEARLSALLGSSDPEFATLSDNQKLTENYFNSGRLDSMAIMNFLLDTEVEFEFRFTPEAFQDRRIHTIEGLARVVSELKGGS